MSASMMSEVELILFALQVSVRLTVLLAVLFALDRVCQRRHSGWRNALVAVVLTACTVMVASGSVAPPMEQAEGGADGAPHQTAYALPVEGIVLDGQLDDWPTDMPRYRIGRQFPDGGEPLTGPADHLAYFRLGYSVQENALYVAVEVDDESVVIEAQDRKPRWDSQDGCEIYLSPHYSEANALPVQYYRWGSVSGVYPSERGDLRDFSVAQHWGNQAYTFEWRVDIGRISDGALRLTPGMVVGFDITMWDRDADGSRTWMIWGTPVFGSSSGGVGDLVLTTAAQLGEVRAQVQTKGPVGMEPFAGAWYELWQDSTQVLAGLIDEDGVIRQRLHAGSYRLRGAKRGLRTSVTPLQVVTGQLTQAGFVLEDPGTCFYVDDDAQAGGNGTQARPFRTIQQGLMATSYGDTVRLAPGMYRESVELISGVTILGSGVDQTRVAGEAHWGLALRPFIDYYERGEEELGGVYLPDVSMAGFTLDGGDRYPSRAAQDVSDLLAAVTAIGHGWRLVTYPTSSDVADVRALLERNPGLAKARIFSPDAYEKGSTLLHDLVRVYENASDAKYEIAKLLIEHGADVNARGGSGARYRADGAGLCGVLRQRSTGRALPGPRWRSRRRGHGRDRSRGGARGRRDIHRHPRRIDRGRGPPPPGPPHHGRPHQANRGCAQPGSRSGARRNRPIARLGPPWHPAAQGR